MAKLVVHHEQDPAIGIVLEEFVFEGRFQAWQGRCTQCRGLRGGITAQDAITRAQKHVDSHESAL